MKICPCCGALAPIAITGYACSVCGHEFDGNWPGVAMSIADAIDLTEALRRTLINDARTGDCRMGGRAAVMEFGSCPERDPRHRGG